MKQRSCEFPLSKAEASAMLERHGIKATRQRVEIAHFLFQRPQHLAAEQILEGVKQNRALVSKATVYNTLGLFVRKGLVREVLIDPERIFYDSNTTPHYHVYNIDTSELSDVDASRISVDGIPDIPPGMEIESMELIIHIRNEQPL